MKKCICCHKIKNLSEFAFRSDTKRYRNKCKSCHKIKLPSRNYCCMDCGDLISPPTALKGNGRCNKCAKQYQKNNNKTLVNNNIKFCIDCKNNLPIYDFSHDKNKTDGYCPYCKKCASERKKIGRKTKPWNHLYGIIKRRCEKPNTHNYKWYGGRGIKFLLTKEEIKSLMIRDKYWEMERPSIDRIDNDGDYTYENCRFIEQNENSAKQWIDKTGKENDIIR